MFKLRKRYNLKKQQGYFEFVGSNTSLKNFHVSRCVRFPLLLKTVHSRLGAETCCWTFGRGMLSNVCPG